LLFLKILYGPNFPKKKTSKDTSIPYFKTVNRKVNKTSGLRMFSHDSKNKKKKIIEKKY